MPGSYGAPPGWSGDGSLLIRRDLTPGLRDEHERVTRIAVAEEGRVVVRSWIEGLYGKGEGYAHTHEITVEKGRRIREIMEELRGGPVSPEAEEELLAIVDE